MAMERGRAELWQIVLRGLRELVVERESSDVVRALELVEQSYVQELSEAKLVELQAVAGERAAEERAPVSPDPVEE